MFPTIFASTRRVLRVIPLLNPHHQNTFPPSVRLFSPPSHRKRKGGYAGSQIVASVAGTTKRIRLASRRKWSLVMSVVVVVGFYIDNTRVLLTYPQVIQLAWTLAPLPILCVPTPGSALNVRRARFVRKKATMYAFRSLQRCCALTFSMKGSYSLL